MASLDEETGSLRGAKGTHWERLEFRTLVKNTHLPGLISCRKWGKTRQAPPSLRPETRWSLSSACVSAPPSLLGPLAPRNSLRGHVLSGYPPPIPTLGIGASRGQRSRLSTSVSALLRAVGGRDLESLGGRKGGVWKVARGGRPRTVLDPGLARGAGIAHPHFLIRKKEC